MTGYDDIEQALHAAMAGAAAYCSKDVEPKALLRIIRDVADGKFVFGAMVMDERAFVERYRARIQSDIRAIRERLAAEAT